MRPYKDPPTTLHNADLTPGLFNLPMIVDEDKAGIYYETNILEKVGKTLLDGLLYNKQQQIKDLIDSAYFKIGYRPQEDLEINFEKNTYTQGVPWGQDYKLGMTYDF